MTDTITLAFTSPLGLKIAARAVGRDGGIKQVAEGRSDVFKVNPAKICIEKNFNVRDFESEELIEHVDSLAQSIAANGLKRPIKVRNRGRVFVLVDGECRLRAVHRAIEVYGAEINTIPVMLSDRSESDADAVLGLITENSGLPLSVTGKSEVVKRLNAYGWSNDEIATKTGMSSTRVIQLLDYAGLSSDVKSLVRDGVVSATTALAAARANDFDGEKTAQVIREASQSKIAASGKARVTARALSGGTVKSSLANIFRSADVETLTTEGSETVIITISGEEYNTIKNLLKLV